MVTIISKAPPTQKITGYIWIPPSSPIWKIEIVRSDGTADDVTDYCLDGTQFTIGTTEVTGVFTIKVDNSGGSFTDIWSARNTVNLYMDYGSSAATKVFKGTIDRIAGSLSDQYIYNITGRVSYASLREINVTKSYSGTEASAIITDLFSSYTSGYTTNNVNSTTTNLTIAFQGKPFWDCIVEVCNASGMDCYIDTSDDVHFIAQNSVTNTTDAIVSGQNLIETGEFGAQTDEVRNKIQVYGAEVNGVPMIWPAEDSTSQALYGVKEEIVTDTNLTTISQVQEYASYILSQKKDPPQIGKVTSFILATLVPAQLLKISDQPNGLKSSYRLISFTHMFNHTDMPKSEVTINKEPLAISKIFKGRYSSEQSISDLKNQFDMKYSYVLLFDNDNDTLSHSNTTVTNGVLKLSSGSSGTFISNALSASSNITSVELKVSGENLTGNAAFYISVDNGLQWTTVTKDTQYSVGTGRKLKVKVEITDSSVTIDTISILFK